MTSQTYPTDMNRYIMPQLPQSHNSALPISQPIAQVILPTMQNSYPTPIMNTAYHPTLNTAPNNNLSSSTEIVYVNNQTPTSAASSTPTLILASTPTEKIEKCLHQMEHKSTYNKNYYQERTKPKKVAEKQELQILRDKVATYEAQIKALCDERQAIINNMNQLITVAQELETRCKKLYEDNVKLTSGEVIEQTQN